MILNKKPVMLINPQINSADQAKKSALSIHLKVNASKVNICN
jgi:hypothetical protein